MKNQKMKRMVIPGIYLMSVLSVIGCILFMASSLNKYFTEKENFNYSIDGITDVPLKPVQAEDNNDFTNLKSQIIRPYNSDKVSIGRNFYDFKGDAKLQENSIIFYENTYIQNTGIDYISEEEFDVISVLPGKVTSVETDETLGNVIKIEHDKNILTVYEGVNDIKVKVGDSINQGQVLAKSGTSSINSKFSTSLHFEVYKDGTFINPEEFYSLNMNEL